MRPLFLAFVCFGCSDSLFKFDLESHFAIDTKSYILVVSGDSTSVVANDIADNQLAPQLFDVGDSPVVTAFLYPWTIDEMGLKPINPQRIVDTGRPIPDPANLLQAAVVDGVENPFFEIEREALAANVASIRLPDFDLEACSRKGGCSLDTQDWCTLPCSAVAPALPASPEDPRLEPAPDCPQGWVSGELCRPFPLTMECERGLALFPGSSGCVAIGRTCSEEWDESRVYVDAQATSEGTGSREDPFRSLAGAILSGAARIALFPGLYSFEDVTPPRSVDLIGSCVESTEVSGKLNGSISAQSLSLVNAVVEAQTAALNGVRLVDSNVFSADLEVRDLRTSGGFLVGRETVSIDRLETSHTGMFFGAGEVKGLNANDSEVTVTSTLSLPDVVLNRSRIFGDAPLQMSQIWSEGSEIYVRSTLNLRDGRVGPDVSIRAAIGSKVLVENVQVHKEGLGERPSFIEGQGDFVVRKARINNVRGRLVEQSAGTFVLSDAEIVGDAVSSFSEGAAYFTGTDVTFERVSIRDQGGRAVSLNMSNFSGEDVRFDNLRSRSQVDRVVWTGGTYDRFEYDGPAIYVILGAVRLSRIHIDGAVGLAIGLYPGSDASTELSDVRITNTRQIRSIVDDRNADMEGLGIELGQSESTQMRRVLVEGGGVAGVRLGGVNRAELEDFVAHRIARTPIVSDQRAQLGAGLISGCSSTTMTRFEISESEHTGVLLDGGTLTLVDGRVSKVGDGIMAFLYDQERSNLQVNQVRFSGLTRDKIAFLTPTGECRD